MCPRTYSENRSYTGAHTPQTDSPPFLNEAATHTHTHIHHKQMCAYSSMKLPLSLSIFLKPSSEIPWDEM